MLIWMTERQWPTSKKNGRIMFGHYFNTVVEPRCEILHVPCLFLVGREYTCDLFYLQDRIKFLMDILVVGY